MLDNRQNYESEEEMLDIEYDFSELYRMPDIKEELAKIQKEGSKEEIDNFKRNNDKARLKALQKIAKNNSKLGLAWYEKRPNFLKRLWDKITTPKLTDGKQKEDTKTETSKGATKWVDEMYNYYINEKDSRGFSAKRFEQQISGIEGVSIEDKKELFSRIAKVNEPTKKQKFDAQYKAKTPEVKVEEKPNDTTGKEVVEKMSEGKEPGED